MQTITLQFRFLVVGLLLLCSAFVVAQDTATLTGTIRDNTTGVNPYVSTGNFLYSGGAHMPRVLQFALRITF